MPFWSRAKDQDRRREAARQDDGRQPAASASRDPDEHSRLLPTGGIDDQDRILTVDDPAVSPYNLRSIRALRAATVLFAIVALVWWAVQLVSTFVTPPGLHCRGSCFFAYAYASLALANLLFSLLFFTVPSSAVRALAIFMAVALTIDVIITIAVERTRYEEGWVGIVSVAWAAFTSLWTVVTDRSVKWGKAEEEERLTGRAETRRTLWEHSELLVGVTARAIMSAAVALITLSLIVRALDASLVAPGSRHWVDGHRYQIHVYCRGNGSSDLSLTDAAAAATASPTTTTPTVLIEGGEDAVEWGLWQLAEDAVRNGSIAGYCFTDRPGLGWSDAAPSPLTAGMAADALSEALAKAGQQGPWVVVAAGTGATTARIFAARHTADLAGLMLIDPLHHDLLAERLGARLRGLRLWLRGITSPLGIPALPAAALHGHTAPDRVWGRDAAHTPRSLLARLQESVAALASRRELVASAPLPPHLPLVVISSGQVLRADPAWAPAQRALAGLTDAARWDVVRDAPHRVWDSAAGTDIIRTRLAELVAGAAATA